MPSSSRNSGFENIKDNVFATALANAKQLRKIVLSWVASLLAACPNMEVLKVAGIQSWDQPNFCLPNLHTLKLAHLALSDAALASLPSLPTLCPELRRLDLSFTLVKNVPFLLPLPNAPSLKLEKLNLTSTSITPAALEELLKLCMKGRVASASANGVGLTMDDAVLDSITKVLSGEMDDEDASSSRRLPLEDLSLVGNLKLGLTPRHDQNGMTSLARFITRIGRSCKRINLSNLVHLQSSDLVGLMPPSADQAMEEGDGDDTTASNLEILLLNNTPIDSSAAVYISTCRKLETLGLAGTRIDEDGLFTILDACSNLVNLDLTSCRSVKVVDRRRFFEVWEDRRRTGNDG
ncbi:hypothetical protein CPB84DRAFT_1798067 [Gymnopilus junonius]|uniref:RNI-like protein n=1 Tax=Gymnopilus junonius TaxID=109634 RepID=A0A9P5TGA1_GYMJU|nr:hypothetical protein CPB84DRAFT_1798067 [Gymnopilus junonius]